MIALWPALKCRRRMVLLQVFLFVRFADVGANAPEACQFSGSAGRLASSEVSRLGGARRLAVRRDDEGLLQGRGATVHNTRTDDGDGAQARRPALGGKPPRCRGWMGAAAAWTALYSSSRHARRDFKGLRMFSRARRNQALMAPGLGADALPLRASWEDHGHVSRRARRSHCPKWGARRSSIIQNSAAWGNGRKAE
jgi:hypothetical protein